MKPDKTYVAPLIINDKGELLIIKVNSRDIWTSLGGGIEDGDSEEEALVREIREEVGLTATKLTKYITLPVEPAAENSKKFIQIIYFLVEATGEPKLDEGEDIAEYKWVSLKQAELMKDQIGTGLRKYAIPKLKTEGLMK
ncbi:NUDIX hydrolase [Candidatus Nomurabacteria bacterium]|uniref:NUDIX hydrolase n=1 Tax=Candidatus Dojkabacteria bacterium TaxID=2099670 RepID=A0A955KXL2_9BACT|nr:NUDIX hydrolase [Candidatus Dojkabacteria bacterium]MCB9790291.1 NUDIX hydrolase [Candidatus Nomurabacteria bacterium]